MRRTKLVVCVLVASVSIGGVLLLLGGDAERPRPAAREGGRPAAPVERGRPIVFGLPGAPLTPLTTPSAVSRDSSETTRAGAALAVGGGGVGAPNRRGRVARTRLPHAPVVVGSGPHGEGAVVDLMAGRDERDERAAYEAERIEAWRRGLEEEARALVQLARAKLGLDDGRAAAVARALEEEREGRCAVVAAIVRGERALSTLDDSVRRLEARLQEKLAAAMTKEQHSAFGALEVEEAHPEGEAEAEGEERG